MSNEKKSSPASRLAEYRLSVPKITKNCEECGNPFETQFGKFCAASCKSRAHKKKKKEETYAKAKGSICNFCGVEIDGVTRKKFCSNDHKDEFHAYKRSGRKLKIFIDAKTTIMTDKYDKVEHLVKKLKEHMSGPNAGPPGSSPSGYLSVGGNTIKGDMF